MRKYLVLTTAFLATLWALAGIKTQKERLPLSGIVFSTKASPRLSDQAHIFTLYRNDSLVFGGERLPGDTLWIDLSAGLYRLDIQSPGMQSFGRWFLTVDSNPQLHALDLKPGFFAQAPPGLPTQTDHEFDFRKLSSTTTEDKPSTKYKREASRSVAYDAIPMAAESERMESSSGSVATGSPSPAAPGAGTLTAGEVNDFLQWSFWEKSALPTLLSGGKAWSLFPRFRTAVYVQGSEGQPLANVPVDLIGPSGNLMWSALTDNQGHAELWAHLFRDSAQVKGKWTLVAGKPGTQTRQNFDAPAKGWRTRQLEFTLNLPCRNSNKVDVAFVVDATGSMGDELNYLKSELDDVIQKAIARNSSLEFRTAAVVYRDHGDEYLTRFQDFEKGSAARSFLSAQAAGGGGDFPEAVDEALEVALRRLSWNPEARTRILFIALDAPPHQDELVKIRMQTLTAEAAARGIRIVTLACSGMDASAEFLMRSIALATNGTYTSLTDDSKVGGSHRAPVAASLNVQKLNALLADILYRFTWMPDCSKPENPSIDSNQVRYVEKWFEQLQDQPNNSNPEGIRLTVFPNPTTGPFQLRLEGGNLQGSTLHLLDLGGRVVQTWSIERGSDFRPDISHLPSGMYYLALFKDDFRIIQRIILQKR